jgi:hypothetical protein
MRMKALLAGGFAAAALAVALTGCSTQSDASPASGGTHSSAALSTAVKLTGTFAGLNGKKVAGDVTITGDKVALSGFSSDQGPDLHLYLTDGTDESDIGSGTEISTVAYDTAAQTFTLPSGTDASKFTDLVVHCDKAKAVFGAAELSQ